MVSEVSKRSEPTVHEVEAVVAAVLSHRYALTTAAVMRETGLTRTRALRALEVAASSTPMRTAKLQRLDSMAATYWYRVVTLEETKARRAAKAAYRARKEQQ